MAVAFEKNSAYYNNVRRELIDMLPNVSGRFLEIGCGGGGSLEYVKSKGAEFVAGMDINPDAVADARKRGIDTAVVGNIEKDELPFERDYFDCIVVADVLEHLYDPWSALEKLVPYLRDNGCMLMSIPNVRFYRVLLDLIVFDRWTYTAEGVLDSSHLRFFTLKEIKKLLDSAGLEIEELGWSLGFGKKLKILNRMLFNRLRPFGIVQYHVLARRK